MLRLVNLSAMSMVESMSVLSLCVLKNARLLNHSWFTLERSQGSFTGCTGCRIYENSAYITLDLFYHFLSFWVGLLLINSVFLSARLSLPETLVTLRVFAMFGSVISIKLFSAVEFYSRSLCAVPGKER